MRLSSLRAISPPVLGFLLFSGTVGSALGNATVFAQTAAAAATQAAPKALYIEILQGEGELNDIRARTAREPIVQIKDENHKPVAGALVLFTIDSSGGGARRVSFGNTQSLSVRTDANGQAVGQGYEVLKKAGQVRILVHVVLGLATADAVITQTNYAPGSKLRHSLSSHKVLLASAGALAAAVALIAVESSDSPATIQAGTGVVRGIVIARK